MSSVLIGSDLQDAAITTDSRTRYHKAIGGVRQALEVRIATGSNETADETLLMTCMACGKYEVCIARSLDLPKAADTR